MLIVGRWLLVSLPWQLYGTFVVEQRHGFNQQTLGLFLQDQMKMFTLLVLVGGPVCAGMVSITRHAGAHFYVWLFLFVLGVQLFLYTVYPVLIQPWFYTMQPLPADSRLVCPSMVSVVFRAEWVSIVCARVWRN